MRYATIVATGRYVPEIEVTNDRSEEHTSELQSLRHLVCRLLLEKKKSRSPASSMRSSLSYCFWRCLLRSCQRAATRPDRLACPGPPRGFWSRGDVCFFFNDTATTEIYTLSLHDALPISRMQNGLGVYWKMPTSSASAVSA